LWWDGDEDEDRPLRRWIGRVVVVMVVQKESMDQGRQWGLHQV
jgi:hypothetical protein